MKGGSEGRMKVTQMGCNSDNLFINLNRAWYRMKPRSLPAKRVYMFDIYQIRMTVARIVSVALNFCILALAIYDSAICLAR